MGVINRNSIHTGPERDRLIPIKLQLGPGVEIIGGCDTPTPPDLRPWFGLYHNLIAWIARFLSARSIADRVDGFLSKPHPINLGVPQGSAISPAIFLLFITDLLSSASSSIFSFADDTL